LVLPRGGPVPPPPQSVLQGQLPSLPPHLAQLLLGAPPGAAAAAAAPNPAAAGFGLPAFVAGLGNPFGGAAATGAPPSAAAATAGGGGGFPTGGPGAVAALSAAASQLAPFFTGALPTPYAAATGALGGPGVVLTQHLPPGAAAHHFAAAWQQQGGQ
ncbi:hypothetical protein Vretimale_6389, partial [Volvox reticuliferus]